MSADCSSSWVTGGPQWGLIPGNMTRKMSHPGRTPDFPRPLRVFPFPHCPWATGLRGQRRQRQHEGLCTACEYDGNGLPGGCLSGTAQLHFSVMGIYRMGAAAGALPNLHLGAWSYLQLEHNTNYHMNNKWRTFAGNYVKGHT